MVSGDPSHDLQRLRSDRLYPGLFVELAQYPDPLRYRRRREALGALPHLPVVQADDNDRAHSPNTFAAMSRARAAPSWSSHIELSPSRTLRARCAMYS